MIRERLVKIIENLAPTPIAWIAIVVGVFVHFIGFFLFKVEVLTFNEFDPPEAYVSYVILHGEEGNAQLRERALLSDSVPLFLPSRFDYSWALMQPSSYVEDRNATMLTPFEFRVETDVAGVMHDPFEHQPSPVIVDFLNTDFWSLYRTLGERDVVQVHLPVRFGMFEFKIESTGKVIREVEIKDTPIEQDVSSVFWKPCEVFVFVGQAGCIGDPFVKESSGIVAIDQYVGDWVRDFCNRRMVPVGYYRVIFGP